MGLRLNGDDGDPRLKGLAYIAAGWGIGMVSGLLLAPDTPASPPTPAPPKVEISTEALLDAATIEMRGYDQSGKPGVFLYDCEHDGDKLVCTQQEGEG